MIWSFECGSPYKNLLYQGWGLIPFSVSSSLTFELGDILIPIVVDSDSISDVVDFCGRLFDGLSTADAIDFPARCCYGGRR